MPAPRWGAERRHALLAAHVAMSASIACLVASTLSTNGSTPGHSGLSRTAARTWAGYSRRYSRAIRDAVPSAMTFHRSIPSAVRRILGVGRHLPEIERGEVDALGDEPIVACADRAEELSSCPRIVDRRCHGRLRQCVEVGADETRFGVAGPSRVKNDQFSIERLDWVPSIV